MTARCVVRQAAPPEPAAEERIRVRAVGEPRSRDVAAFQEWHATLEAPSKDVIYLDTSGHRPMFEQPDQFVSYMADTVLAATAG